YPKRLIGFCTVQPQSLDAAITEIERCAQGGARGIGEMRPDIQLLDLGDDPIIAPFMETIKQHRLIFLTHTSEPAGHDYPGKGIITPDILYPFITTHPDITIVCAHWGGGLPFYALMPEVQKALRNVYFDTAASPFLYQPQIYALVSQLVGADKILFGSDYPLLPQSRLLQEIKATTLSDEEKGLITGENARKLLEL
ncbi:MAG TPA: amidohydrolase family protein, partial [Dehalococcoidales bacterium]|nr:amidohydrolase family protein [Dehalococcoidales bacterium]